MHLKRDFLHDTFDNVDKWYPVSRITFQLVSLIFTVICWICRVATGVGMASFLIIELSAFQWHASSLSTYTMKFYAYIFRVFCIPCHKTCYCCVRLWFSSNCLVLSRAIWSSKVSSIKLIIWNIMALELTFSLDISSIVRLDNPWQKDLVLYI